jgi:hypothetical protein
MLKFLKVLSLILMRQLSLLNKVKAEIIEAVTPTEILTLEIQETRLTPTEVEIEVAVAIKGVADKSR